MPFSPYVLERPINTKWVQFFDWPDSGLTIFDTRDSVGDYRKTHSLSGNFINAVDVAPTKLGVGLWWNGREVCLFIGSPCLSTILFSKVRR